MEEKKEKLTIRNNSIRIGEREKKDIPNWKQIS
jgi:hypothetical protein